MSVGVAWFPDYGHIVAGVFKVGTSFKFGTRFAVHVNFDESSRSEVGTHI